MNNLKNLFAYKWKIRVAVLAVSTLFFCSCSKTSDNNEKSDNNDKNDIINIDLPDSKSNSDDNPVDADLVLIVDTERDENGQIIRDDNGNSIIIMYYHEIDTNDKGQQIPDTIHANTLDKRSYKNAIAMERLSSYDVFRRLLKSLKEDSDRTFSNVIIKCMPTTTYESFIRIFDELSINQIRRYSIQNLDRVDTIMLKNFGRANNLDIIH